MYSIGYRPTWAEVDLASLEFNFRQIKKIIGKKRKIMAVIKCDAYGHGLLPMAKRLGRLDVDYLGVASIDEAIILRKNKISLPILILGNILKHDLQALIKYNLCQTISNYQLALDLNKRLKSEGKFVTASRDQCNGSGK